MLYVIVYIHIYDVHIYIYMYTYMYICACRWLLPTDVSKVPRSQAELADGVASRISEPAL